MPTMIATKITMPEDLYRRLRDYARAHGTTVGHICSAGARRELDRLKSRERRMAADDRAQLAEVLELIIGAPSLTTAIVPDLPSPFQGAAGAGDAGSETLR